jgi:uncharacterized membrane protein YgdD (TMEM256/DUF423 family)
MNSKRKKENQKDSHIDKKEVMAITGENEQGLRKIIDMTRMISIVLLLLHLYFYCYEAFRHWELYSEITDRFLNNLLSSGIFTGFNKLKLWSIGVLIISLIGAKGRKKESYTVRHSSLIISLGLILFFGSYFIYYSIKELQKKALFYILTTVIGYLVVLRGGTTLARIVKEKFSSDVFNTLNETFPQEERLLTNEYSINLEAEYNLKGNSKKSWINIINPFRGILVIGSPGSGKTYFIIQQIIKQQIQKGFSLFVYDFKYDDLTKLTYNLLEQYGKNYRVKPKFYAINFEDVTNSHRCNPLDPYTMTDITDAAEASRAILMGLNREWIRKQGEFFVESPINFLTALIWFLKKYEQGKYCTLPHVIELMQVPYEKLFAVLNTEAEIQALINPFIIAYQNNVMEQVEGQVGAAKIALARLSSPDLYYVLSGNDFTLDVNNPKEPKIVCMGNNPQKQMVFGAVISLYVSKLIRVVNKQDQLPCGLIFDEFPTVFFNGIDSLIATARSNKVATTLAMQDYSQLKKDYGKEQAEVIMNIAGNVICGQVSGDTAKQLSERFGKILQDKTSMSINSNDTSISKSKNLDLAIPPSTISTLSSGHFVGMVADNPECPIKLKVFHAKIFPGKPNGKAATGQTIKSDRSIEKVAENYLRIKKEIETLVK